MYQPLRQTGCKEIMAFMETYITFKIPNVYLIYSKPYITLDFAVYFCIFHVAFANFAFEVTAAVFTTNI